MESEFSFGSSLEFNIDRSSPEINSDRFSFGFGTADENDSSGVNVNPSFSFSFGEPTNSPTTETTEATTTTTTKSSSSSSSSSSSLSLQDLSLNSENKSNYTTFNFPEIEEHEHKKCGDPFALEKENNGLKKTICNLENQLSEAQREIRKLKEKSLISSCKTLNEILLRYSKIGDAIKVRHALCLGANINTKCEESGKSALHFAAENFDLEVLKELIEFKGNHNNGEMFSNFDPKILNNDAVLDEVNAESKKLSTVDLFCQDNDRNTALHSAIIAPGDGSGKKHDVIQFLVKKEPDLCNVVDKNGHNSLHVAVIHGLVETTKQLLKSKVNVNQCDDKKQTALHLAIIHKQCELVPLLIKLGHAKLDIKDENGDTALSLAVKTNTESAFNDVFESVGQPTQQLPDEFVCPITHNIMKDPVVLVESGFSYEKSALLTWFQTSRKDPMTGTCVIKKTISPNISLRKLIQKWKEDNKYEES